MENRVKGFIEVSGKPNLNCLRTLQEHSTRAWVYRAEQGWLFTELTPEELAEFRSYEYGVTITSMMIRPPRGAPCIMYGSDIDRFANCFAYCTMPQVHSLALACLQMHQVTGNKTKYCRNLIEPKSYEAWLWADEIKFCRELGCQVTVHSGYGWTEWISPPPYRERVFIYAIVNELTKEVYVGQSENVGRRWIEHLGDTKNAEKVALIQSLRAQGYKPKPLTLEEVTGEKAFGRERYWISYYRSQGYKIINRDHSCLSEPDDKRTKRKVRI